ncbi:phage tail protein [Acinetobacter qingfengensis]|uniref:Phage tail protein n=1 Tax=Acinetobacter qingfengensis TaxID=1262585 RepID=A0A1E7RCE5_9GAMM|nr:phage tail protein [Acinetobacter qingfengensis]KAA8734910.1 phage tail protein [Acinetobacter qingfengensis]OEY96922.1 phage tail protein [Acinetobacter qingfengensis]
MIYKSIYTTSALQQLAQATTTGSQIRLTHFAVGDGNGYATTPDAAQTQLVRECYRSTVNRVFQDPENDNIFTLELIVPANIDAFVMREVGVFDSNGNLFIVGNLPDVYKPADDSGISSDCCFRIPFVVSNAESIELKIDPNVVIATQSWIINTLTPAYMFPGGTTGQILKKASNADGDTVWSDPSTADVHVSTVEEEQTLAANQTVVTLANITTTGLAVYINGDRISNKTGSDGWQVQSDTKIVLGKSYTAGAKILAVQNDPLGTIPYPLAKTNNLSDVPDKTAARTNLDVFSKTESRANGLPAGSIIAFANTTAPVGYLKANGAAVSRTVYTDLFAAIGTIYGAGDNVNTFNLPDLRAEFIRGFDDARGIDTNRNIGSKQSDAIRNITGQFSAADDNRVPGGILSGAFYDTGKTNGTDRGGQSAQPIVGFDASLIVPTANENRPRNVAMLYCIKY